MAKLQYSGTINLLIIPLIIFHKFRSGGIKEIATFWREFEPNALVW